MSQKRQAGRRLARRPELRSGDFRPRLARPGGQRILQRLRSRKQRVPVLILSVREGLEDRVRLLDLGADDYLVKPLALNELEARVRALIRRGRAVPEPKLVLGKLVLDTNGKRAWLGDTPLDLSAREWAALEYPAMRANRIVSKEQISWRRSTVGTMKSPRTR